MAKIADAFAARRGETLVICDFSPPRGGAPELMADGLALNNADWVLAAYSPGRSARVDSISAARWLRDNGGADAAFTISPRDMNRLALQSLLLGAALDGLQNVVVAQGDPFTPRELRATSAVGDYTATALIAAIGAMNAGTDFRGRELDAATDFCVGATIDLRRGIAAEAALTRRKIDAGAEFFVANAVFDADGPRRFLARCEDDTGAAPPPIFWGVQMMAPGSVAFGDVPTRVDDDLRAGRCGVDIALETIADLRAAGLRTIYLLPPIYRGGARDYGAAREALGRMGRG